MADNREAHMYSIQLKTFLTVCEYGSFTRAAAKLYITPSAVLQQVNALEKRLDVRLVERTRTGVTLTAAGQYLKTAGTDWVRQGDRINEELSLLAHQDTTLTIGTSVLEKCRLLYELWMLYSEENPQVKVNMVPIMSDAVFPKEIDLIESINSRIPWMNEWNFLKICKVSFGFAVGGHHRLARQKSVSLDQLKGESVICFKGAQSPMVTAMYRDMRAHGIDLEMHDYPKTTILWTSAFENKILLAPVCWDDILINMTLLTCHWEYAIPYGIFYRKDPGKVVRSFLGFIEKTYHEGNMREIVPVLGR